MLARRAPGLAWLPIALRKHFTPAAAVSGLSGLAVAIGYVLNAEHSLHQLKADLHHLEGTLAAQSRQLEQLHQLDTRLAVMSNTLDNISDEVNRQREWRERIEDVAERPPHARRKP